MPEISGQILNEKYRILKVLGRGGFGSTYLAEHIALNKNVALKEFFVSQFHEHYDGWRIRLNPDLPLDSYENFIKLQRKFINEAQILFEMRHPAIVRVIDIFEDNGTFYYAMDYVNGRSLEEILRQRGVFPEDEALHYVGKVAEALQYVHSRHCLHLDVKPANILVDDNGKVTLIDFGAAKQYDRVTGSNHTELLGIFSPGYAPLEQVRRDFSNFSPAVDVYALGATLYRLLTGRKPANPIAIALGDEKLEPLPPHISKQTRDLVLHALQLYPQDRLATVQPFISNPHLNSTFTPPVDDVTQINFPEATIVDTPQQPVESTPILSPAPNFQYYQRDKKSGLIGLLCGLMIAAAVGAILYVRYDKKESAESTEVNKNGVRNYYTDTAGNYHFGNNNVFYEFLQDNPDFRQARDVRGKIDKTSNVMLLAFKGNQFVGRYESALGIRLDVNGKINSDGSLSIQLGHGSEESHASLILTSRSGSVSTYVGSWGRKHKPITMTITQ